MSLLKSASLMPLYDFFGGLSEFWAAVFAVCAIILAFKGKLDGSFTSAISVITSILVAHDALDDYNSRSRRNREGTNNIGG